MGVCSDNYLGEEGAKLIADALLENTTITDLSLKGNDLGDTGVSHICEALLKRKCQIKSLDLGNNRWAPCMLCPSPPPLSLGLPKS